MAGKLLAEPDDEGSEGETLRQALERNDEKGRQIRKALGEAMKATVDPSFMRTMTAATQIGPQLEMARQALQAMAPGMEAIDNMAQHMKGILDSSVLNTIGRGANEQTNLTPSFTIEALRPTEHYILEAQRDTVEAIVDMSTLQSQMLTVMGTQVEVLKKVQEDAAEQTKLNRRMIAIARATLLAACVGIIVSVVVAIAVSQ